MPYINLKDIFRPSVLESVLIERMKYGHPGESEELCFMRWLFFCSSTGMKHLRDMLPVYCWDVGYQAGKRGDGTHNDSSVVLRAAAFYGKKEECVWEFYQGVEAGKEERN